MGFAPEEDLLLRSTQKLIRLAVRALVVLMALVILWGVGDVVWVLIQRLRAPPFLLLTVTDILATFGAFIAVMIAVEIFQNLTVYLRDDVIEVELVMATALMAIARKVIVLDFNKLTADYVWATAAVVLAMSAGYWLVSRDKKGAGLQSDGGPIGGGPPERAAAPPDESPRERDGNGGAPR